MKYPNPAALLAALATLLFSGCSTVIKQSYEGSPASSTLKLSAYSGSTAVYGSVDPEGDGRRLVADEFARLGVAKFSSARPVSFSEIQSEAKDVGADIVLFSAAAPGTYQYVRPMVLNDQGSPFALAPYASASPTAVPPQDFATAPQMGGQEYDYLVSFWRKAPKG
jgi:hypothetical protein